MASSAGALARATRLLAPVLVPAFAYGAYTYRMALLAALTAFFSGPGKKSRIVALVLVLINWKSLPLAWTARIFNGMVQHILVKPYHTHDPSKLFDPVVTSSHVTLLEVDYNFHKSNSTYFADLDVSRTHLVSHLFARGVSQLAANARTRLVMDPTNPSVPAKGKMNVILGGVQCSFKREIGPYGKYEMWSRVLSWDRKWMYIMTHFVEKGKGKGDKKDWQKRIHASALSKYVFKLGRLTIHPSVVIAASGMLPERPGGWVAEENGFTVAPVANGHAPEEEEKEELANGNGNVNGHADGEPVWDWKRVEELRLEGLEHAVHLASLDNLLSFDEKEPLARFAFG